MTNETYTYRIAPCLLRFEPDGIECSDAIKINGRWCGTTGAIFLPPEDNAECNAIFARLTGKPPRSKDSAATPRKPNTSIPIIAIGPDFTVERFPSIKAAVRAGHNERNIWSCRVGKYRKHHGRAWREVR